MCICPEPLCTVLDSDESVHLEIHTVSVRTLFMFLYLHCIVLATEMCKFHMKHFCSGMSYQSWPLKLSRCCVVFSNLI